MDKIILYFKESYNELINKVTWPTWANLQSNTVLVIVASIILALIIFVMDVISRTGLELIYGI
jgi:preprotein translocase subunit SecE